MLRRRAVQPQRRPERPVHSVSVPEPLVDIRRGAVDRRDGERERLALGDRDGRGRLLGDRERDL